MNHVIILGGGLTGLSLAHLLEDQGIDYLLLEARDRLGGRILTETPRETPLEMGATWHWQYHTHVRQWLDRLGLGRFPQYQTGLARYEATRHQPAVSFEIPPQDPSFRIVGGSQQLINGLAAKLKGSNILLNTVVRALEKHSDLWKVTTGTGEAFEAQQVVSTLPPLLFDQTIEVTPNLPDQLTEVMQSTHTWMGDSIKYAVEYPTAFWREQGWAGAGFSQVGPATEVHDHTSAEATGFALKGFLSPGIRALPREQWENALVDQLAHLYGEEARNHVGVHLYDWSQEPYTYQEGPELMPHHNQGHRVYQQGFAEGTLWIAGTETSPHYGGYLEGALFSAHWVAQKLALSSYAPTE
ncbi:MAG: FAD-dependent oxidoreductase [Bacteroidota bacterium]